MENLLQSDQGHYVLCDFGSATARVLKPEVCLHSYTKRYKKWCHTGVWGTSHRRGDQEVYNIVLQVFSTSVSLTVIQMKWCFFCRSPEMVDLYSGLHITTKADIWALGCLLYKVVKWSTKNQFPIWTINLSVMFLHLAVRRVNACNTVWSLFLPWVLKIFTGGKKLSFLNLNMPIAVNIAFTGYAQVDTVHVDP